MRAVFRQVARFSVGMLLLVVGVSGCTDDSGPSVTPTPAADPAALAAAIAGRMSDLDLIGQLLMPSVDFSDSPATAATLVREYRLGGVILMGDVKNSGSDGPAQQVRALTDALRGAAAGLPTSGGQTTGTGETTGTGPTADTVSAAGKLDLLVGTDQEYGWVTRIKSGMVQLPSAMAFGAAAQPELTEQAWRGAGSELAALGVNVDFAPDADVVDSADNHIIGSRSFGADPASVGVQVAAAVRGLQSAGVAASVKHFPGHGHTGTDSHQVLPVLSQSRPSLDAADLPPFQAGIDAGSWLVMAGHLDVRSIDPGTPASFSTKVLVDVLRTKLGFRGVVVTDALNMKPAMRWPAGEAAVRAVLAGADLLLMPPDLAAARRGLLAALANGRLPRARVLEAATRVLTVRFRVSGFTRPAVGSVQDPANRAAARAVAVAAVTILSGQCNEPIVRGPVRITSSVGRDSQREWLTVALLAHGISVVDSGGQLIHLVGYGDGPSDLAPASVTVAMDTPFVLAAATSETRIATYSSTQVAMEALASVLVGATKAAGRSPVQVAGLPRSACVA